MSDSTHARINDALYEIHRDIAAPLPAKKLADIAAYSEQHFHRVFKRETGESVHNYIRRTRLEQAANQLTFEAKRPIQDIADKCGFASLSSFTHAFKRQFGSTPGTWRKVDQRPSSPSWLHDKEISDAYLRITDHTLVKPTLINLEAQHVAYVRHQGYGRSISTAWYTLQAWAIKEQRDFSRQFGLHHSNPTWVSLEHCRYVACIAIDRPLLKRGVVNSLIIPGGLHAAFELTGKYGELLPWISKIQEEWLPKSGLKLQTTPAFVEYKKNHFLESDEKFELTFFLPIGIM